MSYANRAAVEAERTYGIASGMLDGAYRMQLALEGQYLQLSNTRMRSAITAPDMNQSVDDLLVEAALRMTNCVHILELTKELIYTKLIV